MKIYLRMKNRMVSIQCSIAGCDSTFTTNESVSEDATYICKRHTFSKRIRFQDCQFDPDLRYARSSLGTQHISNQGSNILTPDDIEILEQSNKLIEDE